MKHRTADPANALHKRAVLAIATATGSTSLLVSVWFPFLPLYLLQVGARDEAAALFWVAVGMSEALACQSGEGRSTNFNVRATDRLAYMQRYRFFT